MKNDLFKESSELDKDIKNLGLNNENDIKPLSIIKEKEKDKEKEKEKENEIDIEQHTLIENTGANTERLFVLNPDVDMQMYTIWDVNVHTDEKYKSIIVTMYEILNTMIAISKKIHTRDGLETFDQINETYNKVKIKPFKHKRVLIRVMKIRTMLNLVRQSIFEELMNENDKFEKVFNILGEKIDGCNIPTLFYTPEYKIQIEPLFLIPINPSISHDILVYLFYNKYDDIKSNNNDPNNCILN